jgi:hypothetical protein
MATETPETPEATTPEALAAEKLKKAREANESRNQSRLERLSAIADGNDAAGVGEMHDVDGDKLVLKEPPSPEEREAAAAREEEESKRFLAEQEARALQTEGTEPAEEPTEPVKEPAKEPDTSDTKVVNGVTHYLTVVNGKEKWLTLEQLRVAAQKVESADEYLASAAASVRNSSRQAPSQQDESSRVEDVDLEKTLSSAVMGDEDAIKKLAAAIRVRPSAVTPDVLQQFDERWSFRRAAEWFEETYAKELEDPFLKRLMYERDAELAKSDPHLPYKQRLKQAGDEIRTWMDKKSGVAPVKAATSATKLAAKKVLVNVPSAAARQASPEDEEGEEPVEDVIAKMAKARGQSRAIAHGRMNRS